MIRGRSLDHRLEYVVVDQNMRSQTRILSFEGVALARPSYGKLQSCLYMHVQRHAWEGRAGEGI